MSDEKNELSPAEWEKMKRQGAGAFAHIPGVIYPDKVIKGTSAYRKEHPIDNSPKGWLTTEQAGKLLNSSGSSARAVLHRHRVRFKVVRQTGGPPLLFWNPKQVQALVDARAPIIETIPEGYISSAEARKILGIGRSTLYRYVSKGLIDEEKGRIRTRRGTRLKTYYELQAVKKLAAKINRCRDIKRQLDDALKHRKDHEEE